MKSFDQWARELADKMADDPMFAEKMPESIDSQQAPKYSVGPITPKGYDPEKMAELLRQARELGLVVLGSTGPAYPDTVEQAEEMIRAAIAANAVATCQPKPARGFILSVDGEEVARIKTTSLSFGHEPIDVTNDNADCWKSIMGDEWDGY